MDFLTLYANLVRALRLSQAFAHVGAITQPADTLATAISGGLPAVLVALPDLSWLPPTPGAGNYTGLARVELTLQADPARTDAGTLRLLVQQLRAMALAADPAGSALLLQDRLLPGPLFDYRITVRYKVVEPLP